MEGKSRQGKRGVPDQWASPPLLSFSKAIQNEHQGEERDADGGKEPPPSRLPAHQAPTPSSSTIWMRLPIQRMTGTAIELPMALYLGPSGHSPAGLPL
jgi:hypothetical protein